MEPGDLVYSRSTGWNVLVENIFTNGDVLIKVDTDNFRRVPESDLESENQGKPRNPNCK